jgi:NAD(P)-dependent dehydrogenase (short-subunit alcohol dehydrogenase family)
MADDPGRRVALVTGAGRGLGRVVALKLAECGFRLAVTARTFEELAETRRQSGLIARDALILLADLSLEEAPQQVFSATIEHYGRLDVLVNAPHANAVNSSPLESEGEDQDRLLAVNLRAPIAFTRMAARWMAKQSSGGAIINFTRRVEEASDPMAAAAEAGISAFSRAAATVLRAYKVGIAALSLDSPDYISAAEHAMELIGASLTCHPNPVTIKD